MYIKLSTIPILLFCFTTAPSCAQTTKSTSAPIVFVASSPCGIGTRPLPDIPSNAECELIKWKLSLSGDDFNPTTYILTYTWGMSKPGTTGFINGGTTVTMQGKWSVSKGSVADADAIIYILDPDKPASSIHFVKLTDQLLHLLDQNKRLMIGNPSWSYTLNAEKNK